MSFTGDRLVAMASGSDQQNTLGTTASTSYTATLTGGTTCGAAFVAPPSGIVLVSLIVDQTTLSATAYGWTSLEVRNGGILGSGTVFQSPTDATALRHADPNFIRSMVIVPVIGLTAGATYNVRMMFKIATGTFSVQNKTLIVQPQP